jgi:excisionase family DNA binding protein
MASAQASVDYVTCQEAAHELGLSPSLIRRYLRDGRIRGRRTGRDWIVPRRAIDLFKRERNS